MKNVSYCHSIPIIICSFSVLCPFTFSSIYLQFHVVLGRQNLISTFFVLLGRPNQQSIFSHFFVTFLTGKKVWKTVRHWFSSFKIAKCRNIQEKVDFLGCVKNPFYSHFFPSFQLFSQFFITKNLHF